MANSLNVQVRNLIESLNARYEPHVREHLAKVYMILGATTLATAIGASLQIAHLIDLGIIAAIASLGLVLGLHFYQDNGKNYMTRLIMLLSFGACSGQNLGPVMQYIISISPSVILTSIVAFAVIFSSLSLSALFAERGKFLFLGGILISIINTMAIMSILNMIFRSYFIQMAQLYVGVVVMAAFVLFDTQNIIQKFEMGNRDVVQHALDLFFDGISIFRRLLMILIQKQERRNDGRRKRR